MRKKVLITGASGTVGKALTKLLLDKGHKVVHLSRSAKPNSKIETYQWDVKKQTIDEHCLDGVDTIVHLAGAGIADKRWTDERKKVLIESRTETIRLIYKLMREKKNQVKEIISASAAGYYSDRGDDLMSEADLPANDFLANCCLFWEAAVDEGKEFNLRIAKFRTGVILDKDSGALQKIAAPIKYGFGTPLGNGKQWVSWIHLDDVAEMYLKGIDDETLAGAYNMSSPYPITNASLTKSIANQLKKPLWLPNVPEFALKFALGEMAAVVLGSTKMAVKKIEETGFKFKFPEIKPALKDIYG
ncbi:TIGR01777 family oxidoreductase [Pedobacter sp. SD-b]|uniref:TIGR01777 family oxidoreductase n=1 Tax=Pedobacter segetis TaxID=2793069 RepID=A0ABS1BMX6_9SPHI|nr:TIGR01777 family oxidoreductase [Pedobacter segetis]MBK0384117.1 TIGR01777 family oxidoreductase [Pedobacter segetis]